jgi:hypothetical protein
MTLYVETERATETSKYSLNPYGTINTDIKIHLCLKLTMKKNAANYGYKNSARQQQNQIFPPESYAIQLQCYVPHESKCWTI